jgi:hypothetical protein
MLELDDKLVTGVGKASRQGVWLGRRGKGEGGGREGGEARGGREDRDEYDVVAVRWWVSG